MSTTPICPYCGKPSVFLANSASIYHGRDFGPVYRCAGNCDAHVGAHRTSLLPLGRLADKELRALKIACHAAFDPLWRELEDAYPEAGVITKKMQSRARNRAYCWLAAQLAIDPADCHIAAFDNALCKRAIETLKENQPTAKTIRAWAKHEARWR